MSFAKGRTVVLRQRFRERIWSAGAAIVVERWEPDPSWPVPSLPAGGIFRTRPKMRS
jgi:hypothetical protein